MALKASEGAGLTSTHISLAKTGQMARPDTSGMGSIILLPVYDQQGEVATILNKCYHLLHARPLSELHSGDKKALQ